MKKKLFRVTTVALTQNMLLKGQLRFLNDHFDVTAVASDDGMLEEVGRREGVRVINVPMRREISLLSDLKSLYSLYRLFRRERPHIVHTNSPKSSLLSMTAAWMAHVPNRIYTVTGLRYETATGLKRKVLVSTEKITCRFATKVIPEGEGVKRALQEDMITLKNLRVVHNGNINGVDLEYYNREAVDSARVARLRRGGVFSYIFVGRMVHDKGIDELVEAFLDVNSRHPNTRLMLVGVYEPDLDPLAPETVEAINNNPAIVAYGYQNDIRPFLCAADVMVHPSYREGFPNVVLQGGAMGLPVIVTDINGSNEIVREKVNGTIVDVRDVGCLADAMERFFMMGPERLAQMSDNARKVIETRYDSRDVHRELLKMYQTLEN